MQEIERLMLLRVEHPRKHNPPCEQRNCQAEPEDEKFARHAQTPAVQSVREKKDWNSRTRYSRDRNCATPRTGEPPSHPGACVSWISSYKRSRSVACQASACGPEIKPARVMPGISQPSNSHPAPYGSAVKREGSLRSRVFTFWIINGFGKLIGHSTP